MRTSTTRPARRTVGLLLALTLMTLALPAGVGASSQSGLRAVLEGKPIPLAEVARYTCHDRDYPVIHCFRNAAELDADEQQLASMASAAPQQLLTAFVRWYQNANYGGAFFDAYDPYPDLSVIGWARQISSFKPMNGGHPIWWQGANYTGFMWDWGTAQEPTLGGADDQISSVKKG